jgi:hypothetical protein
MSTTKICPHCDFEIPVRAAVCKTCGAAELQDLSNAAQGLVAWVLIAAAFVAFSAYRISAGDVFFTALLGLGTAVFGMKVVFLLKRLGDKSWMRRD